MIITISFTILKRFLYSAVIGLAITTGAALALAQESASDEAVEQAEVAKIQFPVPALGNCANKEACKAFCDRPGNRRPCFEFAKKHGLMKEEKIRKIEKRLGALEKADGGPGGCRSEQACEAYCSDVTRIKECVAFAKQHGIMETHELEEAEKVEQALERGAQLPGGCRNKQACESYCTSPDHMEECLAFAESSGFMKKEELEEARRIMPLMQRGETPGGCRGRAQCEAYCENPDHIDECVAFAEKAGLVNPQELEIMKKTRGRGPGGCRGRFECEQHCENPEHAEECFKFAQEHGLIPPEELERIQKAGGLEVLKQGGPGGCRGKRQCEEFCRSPENQEACFKFAVEKGLLPPEEAERIRELQELRHSEGEEGFGPGLSGEEGHEFSGPGGCRGPRECFEYCKTPEHLDECRQFAPGGPPRGRDHDEDGDEGNDGGELEGEEEFPGAPPHEFSPPPGFGEGPPGQREEGFAVPPGFVPPGIEIHRDEGEEGRAGVEGAEVIRERTRERFEQRTREEFGAREEDVRRRVEAEVRGRASEQLPRVEGLRELPDGFHPPERALERPPERALPLPGADFHAPEVVPQFQPPAGNFPPPGGTFTPPPPQQPVSGGVLRRVLSTLMLIFGL